MSRQVSELLKRALSLPAEARAALAGLLLESLYNRIDPNNEEWNREVARRIQELDSGNVKAIPWAQARRQVFSPLSWAKYLAERPTASPAFMDDVEDLPAPGRKPKR